MSKKCREIISKCVEQSQIFRKWDSEKRYFNFHHSHYDWWAFPIDQTSSHGSKYQVDAPDMPAFLNDSHFIPALRANAILVCRAWGYDLEKGSELKVVAADQKWQRWPIRLYKMACSLELFKQDDLHSNAIIYGRILIGRGEKFVYKHDFSAYFAGQKEIRQERSKKEETIERKIE